MSAACAANFNFLYRVLYGDLQHRCWLLCPVILKRGNNKQPKSFWVQLTSTSVNCEQNNSSVIAVGHFATSLSLQFPHLMPAGSWRSWRWRWRRLSATLLISIRKLVLCCSVWTQRCKVWSSPTHNWSHVPNGNTPPDKADWQPWNTALIHL